jgi:DNA-binding transcriptional LysR family regulator
MLIDLVQLRTFVAVAEEQHLTRAAERIHVSLSAASAHVRAVEDTLQARLFDRTNRGLELTPVGEQLFRRAKSLLNEATLFTAFARELDGTARGVITVGSSGDPVASRIGQIVTRLRERHALVTVDMRVRPSSGTRQGLRTGEIDIGLMLDKPTDGNFDYHHLTDVYFRIAGPVAWREQIESADWAALAALPWITPGDPSMSYASIMDQMFTERGLELNSIARFDNAVVARTLAQAGAGMVLMREEQALQGERAGLLALSPLAHPCYGLFMIYLSTRRNDPLVRAFVEAAASVWPGVALPPPVPQR